MHFTKKSLIISCVLPKSVITMAQENTPAYNMMIIRARILKHNEQLEKHTIILKNAKMKHDKS